jgi:undecaprenyl-diphosphatase
VVELLDILILAIVQGIAEFLPISSSGHLVIVEALLGHKEDLLTINIVLHAGTLLSIFVFYWHRIWRLLTEDRRALGLIVAGTIPVLIVGLPLKKYCEHLLESPLLAGCMLPVTGLMLLWISRRPVGALDYPQMSFRGALVVGLFQAIAILPGISRSGATISGGLVAGLRRDAAATFAFLLAIPAIGGATLLTLLDLIQDTQAQQALAAPIGYLAIGFAVSFAVGLFALYWLLRWLAQGRLHLFAYWCIAVGIAIVAWQLAIRAA